MKIKSGFIAIVGKPNAGKSTLINALVGQKVSIVSPKEQTTRNNILGILNDKHYQLIFVDTPGVNKTNNKLDDYMQKGIKGAVSGVDAIIIAVDSTKRWGDDDYKLISKYAELKLPLILVLTKIDLVKKADLFVKLSQLNSLEKVEQILPVSSVKRQNIDELITVLLRYMPEIKEVEKYFPDDMYTDKSLRFIMGEIVREKALYYLNKEIPHDIAVEILRFEELPNIVNIDADIICDKDSHKGIIIGKQGQMLKKIGHAARVSMQKVLESKVDLNLFVKVKENWKNNDNVLTDVGYTDG